MTFTLFSVVLFALCFSYSSEMGGGSFSQPRKELPDNLNFVKCYRPRNRDVKHLRILLHGPVGAGKSSFINSVESVLQGRVTGRALPDAISGKSFTKKYLPYKFEKCPGNYYSFIFNDIMGFEQTDSGVHVEDIKLALSGHVQEAHKLDPQCPLSEGNPGYNSSPTLSDRVHVLVSVVPAGNVSLISDEILEKMREVRLAASEMGIPQLAILTKVDEACPEVKADITEIYDNKYLKDQVNKFHLLLGIPLNCIFLVKNYSRENKTNDDTNTPIVCALKQILLFGEDYLNSL
ncbi:interferon-induced protein 44 isoform X1 [Lates calcarifer]|uniref:Interferon-induced protein 44 isoform X1 n=1 Tax=Lates calcarifer TaxID=8187 RepID=A0AAJ7LMX8_LATCA|nr:interferon-induced protein 44 isoform X1 [Lates calcarifer]